MKKALVFALILFIALAAFTGCHGHRPYVETRHDGHANTLEHTAPSHYRYNFNANQTERARTNNSFTTDGAVRDQDGIIGNGYAADRPAFDASYTNRLSTQTRELNTANKMTKTTTGYNADWVTDTNPAY